MTAPAGPEPSRDELALPDGRVLARYVARLDQDADGVDGTLVVLRDVTAEREAERLKDEFFALVSHELRTPLTSVIGYLELLREAQAEADDGAAAERAHYAAVIERNARRLLRLVGDLLFVAQIEAGRLSLEAGTADLAAVARGEPGGGPAARRPGRRRPRGPRRGGRLGPRRRRPPRPGHRQPRLQRAEVHPRRRPRDGAPGGRGATRPCSTSPTPGWASPPRTRSASSSASSAPARPPPPRSRASASG